MLYAVNKYNQTTIFKNNVNIKKYPTTFNVICFNKFGKLIGYNSFFRKLYFRSLLSYINICYVTINLNHDCNIFYLTKLPLLYYFDKNVSFYFKKKITK